MTPPIQILGNRALIEMEGANLKTVGEIVIAHDLEPNGYARIAALGDGDKISQNLKNAFANESRIFVGNFIGVPMTHEGKNYRVVCVEDIWAVVKD